MNYERHHCRLCGWSVRTILQLTPTPLANSYTIEPSTGLQTYPLDLKRCDDCGHVQLGYVVDGETLYTEYKYSTPRALLPHLLKCAADLKVRFPKTQTVLEIGSNNGLNAQCLREQFPIVLEVDPGGSTEQCQKTPFTHKFSKTLPKVDLIVANHVFAHIDNLDDVLEGVKECLTEEGALVFEVQYLPDLMKRGAFEMIYHEHRDYHRMGPLARFAKKHGFVLTAWEHNEIQGGSIRVTFQRKGEQAPLPVEFVGLDWGEFLERIEVVRAVARTIIPEGAILFGAPAKACTFLHHCEITERFRYAVDDTKEKQGRYIPGTGILIKDPSSLGYSKSRDRVFLMAWNYEKEIRAKHPNLDFITQTKYLKAA